MNTVESTDPRWAELQAQREGIEAIERRLEGLRGRWDSLSGYERLTYASLKQNLPLMERAYRDLARNVSGRQA